MNFCCDDARGSGHIETTVNRFREQFAALSFPFQGQSVNVTASFGIAGTPVRIRRSLADWCARRTRCCMKPKARRAAIRCACAIPKSKANISCVAAALAAT